MQTDKDFRILVAELALKKLKENHDAKTTIKPGLGKDQVKEILHRMESQLMTAKFSYMEGDDLAHSEMITSIFEAAKDLYLGNRESIEKGMVDKGRVNILWALNVFSGLSRRLKNPGTKPTHGVDVAAVAIRNITRSTDKLWTTKVVAGPRELTVATNLEGLGMGDTLRAALLPPAMVGGVWSEAMFLGAEKIEAEAGSLLKPEELDTKEADGILVNELKG